MKQLNLYLLGAPGSGKGTQTARIQSHLNIASISTGALLRESSQYAEIMRRGGLVPDSAVMELVTAEIVKPAYAAGVVLDGSPRNVEQAQDIDLLFARYGRTPLLAIFLEVPLDVLRARLLGRLSCTRKGCGTVYHQITSPPKRDGLCDACDAALFVRNDDTDAAITTRLKAYSRSTAPLQDFYTRRSRCYRVDGSQAPDNVFNQLSIFLEKLHVA